MSLPLQKMTLITNAKHFYDVTTYCTPSQEWQRLELSAMSIISLLDIYWLYHGDLIKRYRFVVHAASSIDLTYCVFFLCKNDASCHDKILLWWHNILYPLSRVSWIISNDYYLFIRHLLIVPLRSNKERLISIACCQLCWFNLLCLFPLQEWCFMTWQNTFMMAQHTVPPLKSGKVLNYQQ